MTTSPLKPPIPWFLLGIFLSLVSIILTIGYSYYTSQSKSIQYKEHDNLTAIADLKIDQLIRWRQEREGDAWMIHDNVGVMRQIKSYYENKVDEAEIIPWLEFICTNNGYSDAFLFDTKKHIWLSVGTSIEGLDQMEHNLLQEVVINQQIVLSDIHFSEISRKPELHLVIPLSLYEHDEKKLVGILLFRIDPYDMLYPLVQSWPTRSGSAETLLLRVEKDSVVFINELRHKKNSPMEFRLPISNIELPSAMVAHGVTGLVKGVDYRGIPVLSVIKQVPNTNWFMVTKIDEDEIYSPLRKQARFIGLSVAFLIIAVGFIVGFYWRNQLVNFYKKLYVTELEHKITKQYHQESERKLETLMGNLPGMVYRCKNDRNWTMEFVSKGCFELTGYNSEDLINNKTISFNELIVEEDRERLWIKWQEILKKKDSFLDEYKIITKDGKVKWVWEQGCGIFSDNGEVIALEGFIIDITEQKRAEEALLNSEKHYRTLFDLSPSGILIQDTNGTIIETNQAFCKSVGYKQTELIGKNVRIFVPKENSQKVDDHISKILRGEILEHEVVNIRKDDTLCNIELHEIEIILTNGQKGILTITNDITVKRKIEEEKKLLEKHLFQVQKMDSIGTLAGGIAHDFNNILGIILGYCSLLQRPSLPPELLSQSITNINSAVERGTGLVKQILTFARKTDISYGPLDVNLVIKELSKMLAETFPKTIVILRELYKNLPLIHADATQIHQMLLNICVNSRDAMPRGGTIKIKTEVIDGISIHKKFINATEEKYLYLSISDTGIGMDENTRGRIFEPFFTTKEIGKGTGLGLAVVYGVVTSHSGFIDVDSTLGQGTSFHLYFPIPPHPKEVLIHRDNINEFALDGSETIFIIEDEPMLLDILIPAFTSKGYQVLTAKDGEQALEIYQKHNEQISIVISDVGLPKMTGEEVFRRMKEINPKLNIIFTTGHLAPEIKSELLKLGAKDFILKPYNTLQVLQKTRRILDE